HPDQLPGQPGGQSGCRAVAGNLAGQPDQGVMMTALPDVEPLLQRMGEELLAWLDHHQRADPAVVGIHTGGAWVAERLRQQFLPDAPLGSLDIAFYRDDFAQIGLQPGVRPSELPFSVEGRHLVLVDDVLMTGRTIRAGLNELFDYGRPASVT